jgi:hypothetical protein
MSEENGDSVRNCEEQTYGLVRFEKKRTNRKKEPRKMAHDYVIFHPEKP